MPDLYDAVGHGMWAYSHAAFRVSRSTRGLRSRARDADRDHAPARDRRAGPAPALYFAMGRRRNTSDRMHFAARDDMFLPGFFAGFPPDLPPRVRRLLYHVGVGRWLPRVNVFPIRSAKVARVGEVLAAHADRPLAELLPEEDAAAFAERAAPPHPRRGREMFSAASTPTSSGAGRSRRPRRARPSSGAREPRRPRGDSARSWRSSAKATSTRLPGGAPLARRRDRAVQARHRRAPPPRAAAPVRPAWHRLRPARPRPHPRISLTSRRRRSRRTTSRAAARAHSAACRSPRPVRRHAARGRRRGRGPALERELADAVGVRAARSAPVEPELLEPPDGRRRRLAEALAVAPRRAERAPVPRARVRERAGALVGPARLLGGLSPSAPEAREGGLTSKAPRIVTGRTVSACIVSTYAVALSGLMSTPLAARSVR